MAYYDDDVDECRICFDIETEKNKFISPCRCSGTSKYVHKKCLNKWRKVNIGKEAYNRCMECREDYIVKRKYAVEYYPYDLENVKMEQLRVMYFCIGLPIGILTSMFDNSFYVVDFLNGGTREPSANICGYDSYSDTYNCTKTRTLKETLSSSEGQYVNSFFYIYFTYNIQTLLLCLYIFYRVFKNIKRKRDFIIEGLWAHFGWLIFLFKYLLIYKTFINVVYSSWGLVTISIAGIVFEPFTYKLYEKTNRHIIKSINFDNPETIENWSEELSRQQIEYDFSPIPSPANNGTLELEQISIESANSSEYETVSNEDSVSETGSETEEDLVDEEEV